MSHTRTYGMFIHRSYKRFVLRTGAFAALRRNISNRIGWSFAVIGTIFLFGLIAQTAMAGSAVTYTWNGNGTDDNWSTMNNWDQGAVPNSVNHMVVIDLEDAVTVLMDGDYTVGELVIGENATLNIARGNTLTLDQGTSSPTQSGLLTIKATSARIYGVINIRDSGTLTFAHNEGDHHMIGGDIRLLNADSAVEITKDASTFAPYFDGLWEWHGNVIGQHDDATIRLDSRELTSMITIMGSLTIADAGGSPKFENINGGKVLANNGGTLTLGLGVDIQDDAFFSTWEASGCQSSTLKFCETDTLVGHFILDDCATIEVCPLITLTIGTLTDSSGSGAFSGTVSALDAVFASPGLLLVDEVCTSKDCE